ncbi:hypothetical protein [Aneurinibacillus tyrosinisolvens]|uniref:hypothetical protein n=1 Tax=Aneurinibacillus tyrosinisolvens TaxID=1443435 RepID=UPI001F383FF0|nr:hypothetical protein [Aneurinibacillus tyrosinisolvens]
MSRKTDGQYSILPVASRQIMTATMGPNSQGSGTCITVKISAPASAIPSASAAEV